MHGTVEWLYEEAKIKEHIQCEFSKLYTSELCMAYIRSLVMNFSCCMLSEEERCNMGRKVDEEEIRAALWSFKPFWHDVQASACHEVKKAFAHGIIPAYLNSTLITLIPKCNNPESLANYRPINLCNSVYKVISKVLVARIRPLLNKLISPIQTAFMPGRRGVDNVVIA